MKKNKKLNLGKLEVKSFMTNLEKDLKGGKVGTNAGCNTDTIETNCTGGAGENAFALC